MSILSSLSPEEAKVYIELIALGQLTPGELAQIKNEEFESVKQACEGLAQKGFAKRMPGNIPKYIAQYPFSTLTDSTKTVFEQLKTVIQELEEFVESKSEDVDAQIAAYKENVETQFTESQGAIVNESGATTDIIAKQIAENKTKIESIINQANEISKEHLNTMTTNIKAKGEEILTEFQGSITQSTSEIKSSLETKKTTNLDVMNNNSQRVDQINQDTQTKINSITESLNGKITFFGTKINEQLDNESKSITENLQSTSEALSNNLTQEAQMHKEKMTNAFFDNKTKIENNFNSLRESQEFSLSNITKEQPTKTGESLEKFKANVSEIVSKNNSEVSTQLTDISSKLNNELTNFQQKINELFTQNQEKISLLLNNAKEGYNSSSTKISEQLLQSTDNVTDSINKIVETSVKTTQEQLIKNIESNQALFAGGLTNFEKDFTETQKGFIERNQLMIKENVNNTLQQINEIITESKTYYSTLTAETNSNISQQQNEFLNLVKEGTTEFKKSLTDSSTDFNDSISNLEEFFTTTIDNIKERVKVLTNTIAVESKNVQTKSFEEISTNLGHIATMSTDTFDDVQKKGYAAIEKMRMTAVNQLNNVQKSVTGSIEGQIVAVKEGVAGFSDKYNNTTKILEKSVQELQAALGEVAEKMTKIPPWEPDTVPLAGLNTVTGHIENMFLRMNAGITLLTPNIHWLPLKDIKASKISQRITIVVPPRQVSKNEGLIKELLTKTNIRIKTITMEGMVMNYLAADRDGEEYCMGFASEKESEVAGLATVNDDYIALFGKIVIGDYFLARSKEVNRADYGL